jgi:methylated-DNA-protein-cysteine methyltransferase-like protein
VSPRASTRAHRPGDDGEAGPEQRILAVVRALPRGHVVAYGEVARRAGLPGRARLAAKVLSGNTDPDLPWHRVLRADGRIAFPAGSSGHREQARRLKAEGVRVEQGRVRLAGTAGFDIDAEVWAPR